MGKSNLPVLTMSEEMMKKQSVLTALLKSGGYSLLFLACQVIVSVGVSFLLILVSLFVPAIDEEIVFSATQFSYEIMILSALVFLGITFLLHGKKALDAHGLRKTPLSAVSAGTLWGVCAYVAATVLIAMASLIPAYLASQEAYVQDLEAMTVENKLWLEMLYVCLLGPFLEEVLFRGLTLGTLRKSMGPVPSVLVSAVLFALVHGNLYQMVFTLPLGILLGYFALRFDSIWPSFAMHVAFNCSNYPARIALELGYGEESAVVTILTYAVLIFGVIGAVLGAVCHANATEECPKKHLQGDTMAAPEYLIVGLGNPGAKYAANRHNVGFTALEYIAMKENVSVKNLRFKALTGEMTLGGKKILLMKPQTFMNLSGEAVREAAAFYRIPPERILVIFDDINFAPGIFRIRQSGSAGGHNGIKSIISCLSSDAFPRVKIGVGAPPEGWELMNWVLGNPAPADQKRILATMDDVYRTALLFVEGEIERATSLFSGKTHE